MTGIGRVLPDGFGADRIDVAPDGTATASLRCIVETDVPIGPYCPLVAMAREQGGGVVRLWTLHTAGFRPDP
jgi:hypothetical protein